LALVPLFITLEELMDGFPDGIGIIGVEVGGRIATDLMQDRDVGHQYGASATQGLDGGQAESFVERREDEADGLIVKPHQFVVGDAAQIVDILCGCIVFLMVEVSVVCAYDVELTVLDIAEGLDQTVEILTGVERGDGQGKTLAWCVDLRQRSEQAFVCRIIDDGDVLLLDKGIEPSDFLFGERADGQDMPGGPDGQGRHDLIPPVIGA